MSYKIPAGETASVTYLSAGVERFLLTFKPATGFYCLYEIATDGLKKLGRDHSPFILEEKFNITERLLKK